ncbi:MAG TPA: putative oxidoreductase C-terminal domain-containing protein [Chitinophagaceae bacterium]|nr:putative oxidoreductase C-terminal domain-containing protein [Chitinophagaceae bacterium]
MKKILAILFLFTMAACSNIQKTNRSKISGVQLITLDPGHFHAALVQKTMYADVDPVVHVYAPDGPDLDQHLGRIKAYNTRPDNPTKWEEQVYTGNDFLEKMLNDKALRKDAVGKGNVVVMSGNNRKKTEYILKAVTEGFNVLADKPMAIDVQNFEILKTAFVSAKKNDVLLYDIMTERYEISTMLQRELSFLPEIFGQLEKGTVENPAVTKESVHHFFKYVSGSILTRPPWFMDVTQEGEGIVDVTTHLVDLIQWECFPEQIIDYKKDIQFFSARRWPTDMSVSQFNAVTKLNGFPDYLKKNVVKDSILKVFSNGEINYQLKGIHAKVSVTWAYKAPEGAGDTHYSIMRGTKSNLVIRQGAEQKYKPSLYIEPVNKQDASFENILIKNFTSLQTKFPGLELKKTKSGWEVVIPEKYREGHEAHFARVTEKFLQYLKEGKLPAWEVPNMIAKYYTTTTALEFAKRTAGAIQ